MTRSKNEANPASQRRPNNSRVIAGAGLISANFTFIAAAFFKMSLLTIAVQCLCFVLMGWCVLKLIPTDKSGEATEEPPRHPPRLDP
jgi:hypothetical protein